MTEARGGQNERDGREETWQTFGIMLGAVSAMR